MVQHGDAASNLRRAREQFLTAGALDDDFVPAGVLNSWRRSKALQVQPDRVDLLYVRDPDTDTPLAQAAALVLGRTATDLAAQSVSVILTSADGLVLDRVSTDHRLLDKLDDVRLARGYSYAEQFIGTNAIGTTLETGAPTFIRGGEHYVGPLGQLACAGAPIRDPVTGRILGVLDLTCWARQWDPLLFVLAKAAGSQIQDRLTGLINENQAALLGAYLRHSRRFSDGVLAIGGDVIFMNPHLRQALDMLDRTALLEHAEELTRATQATMVVAVLPSGRTARISAAELIPARGQDPHVVFHVHVRADTQRPAFGSPKQAAIPGLVGRSSSWRRSCQEVERCYRGRDWVVITGEHGSGRAKLGQAVAQHVSPERAVRVLRAEDFQTQDRLVVEVEAETDGEDFALVMTNVDDFSDEALEYLSAVLQTRAGRGWIAVTVAAETPPLILPFFTHTVTVAPLRHRIDDLEDLVAQLLRELTRGADIWLDAEAMAQLAKQPWPGNITQLRKVLAEAVGNQRTGAIGVDKLPAASRSPARRRLTRLEALERDAIVRSLHENDGDKEAAAEALGLSRATIYRKIKVFGIT